MLKISLELLGVSGKDEGHAKVVGPNRWVACAGRGGGVVVMDCSRDGKPIAETHRGGRKIDVAWAKSEDQETPLLVDCDGRSITAFRVKPESAPGDKSKEKPAASASR